MLDQGNNQVGNGTLTDIGNGLYNTNLYSGQTTGQFTIQIFANQVNFYPSTYSFFLNVGIAVVNVSVSVPQNIALGPTSIKVSENENLTFNIMMLDASAINETLSVSLGGSYTPYVYQLDTYHYLVTMNASLLSLGLHTFDVNAYEDNYISTDIEITVDVINAWDSQLALTTPPQITPWNNNASFVMKFSCIEDPRYGQLLTGATITNLEVDLTTDSGEIQQLMLGQANLTKAWGWNEQFANEGPGYYLVWFNTSYINIATMSSFEVIPYFTLADYQNAQIAPFLWVRPVDTTLTVQSQTDTQLLTNGLSLPLYNNMTIYTHFNVTDSSSLLNGLNLTSAQVTLQILQDNAAQSVFETISLYQTW